MVGRVIKLEGKVRGGGSGKLTITLLISRSDWLWTAKSSKSGF